MYVFIVSKISELVKYFFIYVLIWKVKFKAKFFVKIGGILV